MYPTSAERIQQQMIADYQSCQDAPPKLINFNVNRYSMPISPPSPLKKKDHSQDFFYGQSTSQDYKYRRNLDPQRTEISSLSKYAQRNSVSRFIAAKLFRQDDYQTPVKSSPPPIEGLRNRRNISNNNINGLSTTPVTERTHLRIQTENLNILSSAFHQDPTLSQNYLNIPQASSKSPIGALSNKLYNTTVRQYPDQDKQSSVTLQLSGNLEFDEIKLKRSLAMDGIQVISCDFTCRPIANTPSKQGSLKLRLNPDQDLQRVIKQLDSQGIKTSIPVEKHQITTEKGQKTWVRQKIAYKSMGFFANRDNDRLKDKQTPQVTRSVHQTTNNPKTSTPLTSSTKPQPSSSIGSSLHKHLHNKQNYK